MSIRDAIFAADKRVRAVDVGRWGVTLYVHRLSLADKLALADLGDDATPAERIALAVIRSVRDADGAPVFTADDLSAIVDADGDAVAEVWAAVKDVSKLNQTVAEAAAEKKG